MVKLPAFLVCWKTDEPSNWSKEVGRVCTCVHTLGSWWGMFTCVKCGAAGFGSSYASLPSSACLVTVHSLCSPPRAATPTASLVSCDGCTSHRWQAEAAWVQSCCWNGGVVHGSSQSVANTACLGCA